MGAAVLLQFIVHFSRPRIPTVRDDTATATTAAWIVSEDGTAIHRNKFKQITIILIKLCKFCDLGAQTKSKVLESSELLARSNVQSLHGYKDWTYVWIYFYPFEALLVPPLNS